MKILKFQRHIRVREEEENKTPSPSTTNDEVKMEDGQGNNSVFYVRNDNSIVEVNEKKKSVRFNLEEDDLDLKDGTIQVAVNNAITTLAVVMDNDGNIEGTIDEEYIHFPSSQKDIARYNPVTEDISDDEDAERRKNETKKDEVVEEEVTEENATKKENETSKVEGEDLVPTEVKEKPKEIEESKKDEICEHGEENTIRKMDTKSDEMCAGESTEVELTEVTEGKKEEIKHDSENKDEDEVEKKTSNECKKEEIAEESENKQDPSQVENADEKKGTEDKFENEENIDVDGLEHKMEENSKPENENEEEEVKDEMKDVDEERNKEKDTEDDDEDEDEEKLEVEKEEDKPTNVER